MGIVDFFKQMINGSGAEDDSAPETIDEDDFCAMPEMDEDGYPVVWVYTPHLGMDNAFLRADIALPGENVWTLLGYTVSDATGQKLAIWQSQPMQVPQIAAELININHYIRLNRERIFVFEDWRPEDQQAIEFYNRYYYQTSEWK